MKNKLKNEMKFAGKIGCRLQWLDGVLTRAQTQIGRANEADDQSITKLVM